MSLKLVSCKRAYGKVVFLKLAFGISNMPLVCNVVRLEEGGGNASVAVSVHDCRLSVPDSGVNMAHVAHVGSVVLAK